MLIFRDENIIIDQTILANGASQYRITGSEKYNEKYKQTYKIKVFITGALMMYRLYQRLEFLVLFIILIIIYILRLYVLQEERILVIPSIGMQINRRYSNMLESMIFIPFGAGSIPHIIEIIKRFRVSYLGVISTNKSKDKLIKLSHFPLTFPALRAIILSIKNISPTKHDEIISKNDWNVINEKSVQSKIEWIQQ